MLDGPNLCNIIHFMNGSTSPTVLEWPHRKATEGKRVTHLLSKSITTGLLRPGLLNTARPISERLGPLKEKPGPFTKKQV